MKKIHFLFISYFLLFAFLLLLSQQLSSHGLPPGEHMITPSAFRYVAQTGYETNATTVAGGNGYGSAANQFAYSVDVFVDATGNIYVADNSNHRIQKWAPGALEGITVAGGNGPGSAPNQLEHPAGVNVDAAGNIYIADAYNDRVQKWAPGASFGITVAGGNGEGSASNQLLSSTGLHVDGSGNIYVADNGNYRIQKWAPGATSGITVATGGYDVFVDASANVYVVDDNNHRIQKWAPGASSGITVAGGNGQGSAANQLNYPRGSFVDAAGNIYVSDLSNYRIQKWAPGASSGITVAGGNGPGSAANQITAPYSVFLDSEKSIYVADLSNNRIQKFEPLKADVISCPPNQAILASSCYEKVMINWHEPRDSFPANIQAPLELDPGKGNFIFIGELNGHGYYRSTNNYLWATARNLARSIGGSSAKGHLVTISNSLENNLIFNNVQGSGYAPWIGLYNTGRQGHFRWVNGESFNNYTNWAPGEPNNAGGSARNIKEPYVRFTDGYGTWNDQPDDHLPFIAEFDKPLIRYKQISGPRNGSKHKAGEYTVCYERTNHITDRKDTCCFTVRITCAAALANETITSSVISKSSWIDIKGLHVSASPNPSRTSFTLKITGSDTREQVSIQISDMTGRIVETRNRLDAKQTLNFGKNLRPGTYFVRVMQGSRTEVVKIVKQ